jgi:hypothetical protein
MAQMFPSLDANSISTISMNGSRYKVVIVDARKLLKKRFLGTLGVDVHRRESAKYPVTVIPKDCSGDQLVAEALAHDGVFCVAVSTHNYEYPHLALFRIIPSQRTAMKMIQKTRKHKTRVWHLQDTTLCWSQDFWTRIGGRTKQRMFLVMTTDIKHASSSLIGRLHFRTICLCLTMIGLFPFGLGLLVPGHVHHRGYVKEFSEDVTKATLPKYFGFVRLIEADQARNAREEKDVN